MRLKTRGSHRPVLLYDGWCPFCRKQVARLKAMLRGVDVDYRSFRDEGVLENFPGLSEERCDKAIQLVRTDGKVFSGLSAIVRLLSKKTWGKLALVYFLPIVMQLGDLAYAWVGKNRFRFNGNGSCTELACTPDRVYRPSGRFTGKAMTAALAGGILAAALLAYPYQWFLDNAPLGFFNLVATIISAMLIGLFVGLGSWWGHGRSAWATTIAALFSVAAFEVMTFEIMSSRSIEGGELLMPHGRLKVGLPIEGSWVYLLWIGEIIALSLVTSVFAARFTRQPYVEPNLGWAYVIWSQSFSKVDGRALRHTLSQEKLEAVFEPPQDETSETRLSVQVHGVQGENTQWVSAWIHESGSKELILRWVRLAGERPNAPS